jgi:hypothetical protein
MAELLSLCPNCKSRLKVPAASRDRQIDCPKCKSGFVPKEAEIACPKCKTALPPKSVFCVGCGFDFRTKSTINAVFVKEPKPKKRKPEERYESVEQELDQPTWREILAVPFNVEFVIAEAIILTMWSFFWAGLFIAIAGGMIMALGAMGIGTIFSACMLLAGIVRMWMVTSDISLQTILMLLMGLLGLSALAGWIVSMADEAADPVGVGLFAFMFFVLFGVALRCVSFYMGRYFGIVRRSALRAPLSVSDRGGFVDLFYGLLVGAVGLGPLLVVWMIDFICELMGRPFPGGLPAQVGFYLTTLFWAYFYMPIGTATVALRGSANPLLALRWALYSFADYLSLLIVYLPFHAVIWVVDGFLVRAINHTLDLEPHFALLLAGFNFFILQMLLNEYSTAATLVALGLVMRRNEAMLHWAPHARRINAERD